VTAGSRRPRRLKGAASTSSRLVVDLGSVETALLVRRHPRACRASLRLSTDGEGVVVVIPAQGRLEDGVAIARRHADWIRDRLESVPARVPFAEGAAIPVYGRTRVVRHVATGRPGVRENGEMLAVGGSAESVRAQIEAWLRGEARRVVTALAHAKAERLGHPLLRISVRDVRSRWGSCSSAGALSFSWRLILAPPAVLDYVVAHEVAHLAERGHGPAFWRTVARLTEHMDVGRAWLRRHGRNLLRYG
jgi:predicted metal-dependent hydrolase